MSDIYEQELARAQKELAEREAERQKSLANPFDARSEVSENARYISGRIVKHLWIIFVLLPVVLGILFAILK